MKAPIFIYDDARARKFEPFALTRPAGSLTAGMAPIWARWQLAMRGRAHGFVGAPHLDGFDEGIQQGLDTAPHMTADTIPAGAVIASARFAPAVSPQHSTGDRANRDAAVWLCGGRVAAVRTDRELSVQDLRRNAPDLESLAPAARAGEQALEGWWLDEVWDLIRLLPEMLADDLQRFAKSVGGAGGSGDAFGPPPPHSVVLGRHPVLVATGRPDEPASAVTIEPHVIFDATNGPIVIRRGVHVHAFTRLNGPCLIADGTTVMGGDFSTCSIGPVCKVRGEMSVAIMCGYANKGHDGFVGHSYLGRWTNLGAGTITSNLKNTYGPVMMWTPDGLRDTGMQFLGTLFGDHAKTGIGIKLTTGTVLGAGANVYGSAMPPKCVPPFAWGERPPYTEYRLEKFLEVAERVMARRDCALSEDCRRQLAAAFAARWTVDGGSGSRS